MRDQPYRFDEQTAAPSPPNVLFDGTRLGLEATLFSGLSFAILAGLQCGISITLGYFMRIADGLPDTANPFAPGRFVAMSLFSAFILIMIFFFSAAIPTMLYTMGLVRFSLFWLRKRKGRDKLANAIAGTILAFLFGLPCSALGLLLIDVHPSPALYGELLHWPHLLSIDGMMLLWMSVLPFFNIIGGVRSGIKIGEIVEHMQMYWFF